MNPRKKPGPEELLAGTPFRFVAMLGEGGMGLVLRVEDTRQHDRHVAVKMLHEHLVRDSESLERFRTEAEIAGLLEHPNIVEVQELRMPPAVARPYFVMEALAGESLVGRLRRTGALDVHEAIDIAIQALEGLAAAHGAGIVHRDVKPGNIFLCNESERTVVKILDFGIAKLLPHDRNGKQLTPHTFKTRKGLFVGTALYASPEQARGQDVDRRTDLYAMGHVLYNMLTARAPFGKIKGTKDLLVVQTSKMPDPPSRLARSPVPPELDDLVMAALAKRPEDRLASAEQFIEALEDIRDRLQAPTGWLRTHLFDPDRAENARNGTADPKARAKREARQNVHRREDWQRKPAVSVLVTLSVAVACFFFVLLIWKAFL